MSNIVENGRERYLEANREGLELQREELEAVVLERYKEEFTNAGFWRRLVLCIKMKRDVRLGRVPSDESLYLSSP